MAKLTLGPVIGKVTAESARVGVEADKDVEIVLRVQDQNQNKQEKPIKLTKGRFTVCQFSNLLPETKYLVEIDNLKQDFPGSFTTLSETPSRMTIAAVSCNFTIRRKNTDAWRDLYDRYVKPGGIDLLMHVGDQIYGDSAFAKAESLLRGRTSGRKFEQEKIKESYRDLYRQAWAYPSTRAAMANVPNLTIWDDHEIRDDWGSEAQDSQPGSLSMYIGSLAHEVYREYQRQLWQDSGEWPQDKFEHHLHTWGDIGVMFIDQRAGRSFHRDTERPYLSVHQWNELKASLESGGEFSAVKALVVVTSVPLVYLGDGITNSGSNIADDLLDHWAYGAHRKEQIELIRALRRWKQSGNRELLTVGGDVHIGLKSEIKHKGKTLFKQLITSPITNKPPPWYTFLPLKGLLEVEQNLGDHYGFEHSGYVNKRNYGIIAVRLPNNTSASVTITSGLETVT